VDYGVNENAEGELLASRGWVIVSGCGLVSGLRMMVKVVTIEV
jgi:hypothetical protein